MAGSNADPLKSESQRVALHSLYRKRPERGSQQTPKVKVTVSPQRRELLVRTALPPASPISPSKWAPRRTRRFLSAVEEGLISVTGAQTVVLTPVLLSTFIMKRSPQPPRLLNSARYALKSRQIATWSAQAEKRFNSASPTKRRTVRPKTSAFPLKESPIEDDGLTAWE